MNQFNIEAKAGELIIREGSAPDIPEPVKLFFSGQINSATNFYQSRKHLLVKIESGEEQPYFDARKMYVSVGKENGCITLYCDENSATGTEKFGKLELSTEYKKFGINAGKSYTPAELAKLLKSNRHLFPDKEKGMELIGILNAYKANVSTDVEKEQDSRANKKQSQETKVTSNIPEGFKINIPIFKGFKPAKLNVEISLDASGHTLALFLESPEAQDIIAEQKNGKNG